MAERKVTVSDLDGLISADSPVTYWQDGRPVQRREIFDDCEVVKLEPDTQTMYGRTNPCIAVYVGNRTKGEEVRK